MIVLPVGHEQISVRRLPWVSFGLMAACLAVHVASLHVSAAPAGSEKAAIERFALMVTWGIVPIDPAPLTLLTHQFLHIGWFHLLGNLLILYLAGPFIEDVWGRPTFLVFYLLSGLSGALLHVLGNSGEAMPMVGASGAIAGVMGGFLVRYGATRIRFWYLLAWLVRGTFFLRAWTILPLWFVQQLTLAVLSDAGAVAYWAHVGGFAAGALMAIAIHAAGLERRVIAPALRNKIHTRVLHNPLVERGLAMRATGDLELALTRLHHAVETDPENPDAARALWSVAAEEERTREVLPRVLRAIGAQVRGPEPEPALDLWVDIQQAEPGLRAEPALLFRIGQALARSGRNAQARDAWRTALAQRGRATPPGFALRVAAAAEHVDPHLALTALETALGHPDLDPSSRAEAAPLRERLAPVEVRADP